jgi:hypothetical protein
MPWSVAGCFRIPENADIVDFILKHPTLSAHDDVASVLHDAARGLGGVRQYCPDPAAYAYVVLHTADNRIFAIAYGQSGLAFRLPLAVLPEALADGGTDATDLGPGWVSFPPWGSSDLRRWCRLALAV